MKNEKKAIIIWRLVLVSLVFIFFGYLFQKNIPIDGRRIVEYNFGEPSGEVGHLRPFVRVQKENDSRVHYVERVLASPAYLDIFSLIPFEKARVEVSFQNSTKMDIFVGLQYTVFADDIRSKPFSSIHAQGEWQVGTVEYDLRGLKLMRGGYIFAFVTSKPLSDAQGTFRVSHIRVILERKPFTIQSLVDGVFHKFLLFVKR